MDDSPVTSRPSLAGAIWLLGMVAVGVQALALSCRYFQPWLSADYIYPQLVAEDVLAGSYPLSGWTLSSAPYLFPDIAVAFVLRVLGGSGPVLPAYVVFSYLALAVLTGWSLNRATRTGSTAWLGGVALVNTLLGWQAVGDHAHYLWLFGTVGFHGGAVLLGLANFALWAGPEESRPSRLRWCAALAVLVLGIFSDTLFLSQSALSLGVGLWAQASWNWRRPGRVRTYGKTVLIALGLVLVVRIGLAFNGWFNFSKVVRYVPTPAAVGRATEDFVRDLRVTLIPGAWGFVATAVVSFFVVGIIWWRDQRQSKPIATAQKPVIGYVLVGLAATSLLPLLATYWRDGNHVRYLLPWLIFPGWFALVGMLPKVAAWGRDWRSLVAFGALCVGLVATGMPQVHRSSLRWPYPERQAQLDEFILSRGLRHGLSDYWHAHEINTLTRAPVRLVIVRPAGNARFWSNNAFWFYDSEGGRLTVPEYNFIITDGLDESALKLRFGEPAGQERVGGLTIWLYAGPAALRLTRQTEVEVHDFLRGRPGEQRIDVMP